MKKQKFLLKQVRLLSKRNREILFSMRLFEQECYGIVCEDLEIRNTLTELFYGKRVLSGGTLYLGHKKEKTENILKLFQKNAAVIGQRKKLIQALSVQENICLFSDVRKWNYNKHFLEKSRELAEQFQVKIEFSKTVDRLTDKERIIVELLKAFMEKREIIVLMGITAFLTKPDLEEIRCLTKKMQDKNPKLSVVLIEIPCDTVCEWSDRIQILKDGMDYGSFKKAFLDSQKLYEFYFIYNLDKQERVPGGIEEYEDGKAVFELQAVATERLSEMSFQLAAGEFLNIFCLDAVSIRAIYGCMSGEDPLTEGRICLDGNEITIKNLKSMRRQRICYCKVHAYETMLIPDMTVRENIFLDLSKKIANPCIQKKYVKSVDYFIERTFGKGFSHQEVWRLSVLDRQKLVFLKLYMEAPKVLVCELPFFDADIRLIEVTKKALRALSDRGIAIILVTMDFDILNWFEGDILFMKGGSSVEEEEVYYALYQNGN